MYKKIKYKTTTLETYFVFAYQTLLECRKHFKALNNNMILKQIKDIEDVSDLVF